MVERVRRWLDTCDAEREQTLTLRGPVVLKLSTVVPQRDEPGPIVLGMVDAVGEIDADQAMWAAITRKINKYRAVKDLGVPFVLFMWEGHWLKVSETSLQWALFGRDQFTIFREQESAPERNGGTRRAACLHSATTAEGIHGIRGSALSLTAPGT